ncbi:16S rRNA processing protein RimM [bacterium]|nr:16S rRNA processing protein RimM [bacterium]
MPIIGKVLSTFGRKGEIKLLPLKKGDVKLLEGRKGFLSSQYKTREVEIEKAWQHKGMWILKFKGIDTIKEAWRLRESYLEIEEEIFPEEESPIGFEVYSEGGENLGKVVDIISTPAHGVLLTDKDVLIPFVAEWIVAMFPQERKLIVKEIKEG